MSKNGVPFANQRIEMTHADFIREIARAAVEARDYTAKALNKEPDSSTERFARIIREQFGTTQKAAPVPDAVKKAAHKAGIPADKLLAALRDIAGEPVDKAQSTATIADVIAHKRKAEPARQSPSDPISAADVAAGMQNVSQSADRVAAESRRTPIGDAIRKQLRELS